MDYSAQFIEKVIPPLTERYYGAPAQDITPLGGGFYGRVFLIKIDREPYNVVLKIYMYDGFAQREAAQLRELSAHSLIKVPDVYFYHNAENEGHPDTGAKYSTGAHPEASPQPTAFARNGIRIPNDVLAMEFIDGINVGSRELSLDSRLKMRLAEAIVENQISYHNTTNPEGFGDIGSGRYEPDWVKYYYPRAESAFYKIEEMYSKAKIDQAVMSAAGRAFNNFHRIFYLPVQKASLIHADYNTWNILFDRDITVTKAVIDPFNCCWSDSELDLYQLTHANGDYFGLLDLYKAKAGVSENFQLKNGYYELYTELMHHYDANVDVPPQKVGPYVRALNESMDYYGL